MFGKIVKHELRASAVCYLVYFGIVLLFCMTSIFGRRTLLSGLYEGNVFMESTWVFFIVISSVSVAVLILMYIIDTAVRYDRSMYGRQGYLTFTLPISSTQLILGKITAAMIWGFGVCVMCGLLLFSIYYNRIIGEFKFMEIFDHGFLAQRNRILILNILWLVVLMVVIILEIVVLVYLSICIAYLPCFRQGNRIIALVLFFVIKFVKSLLEPVLAIEFHNQDNMDGFIISMFSLDQSLLFDTFFRILFIIFCTTLTIYITKKYTSLQ